jgi:hypothetical protein
MLQTQRCTMQIIGSINCSYMHKVIPVHLFDIMSSELLEVEMPPRPGANTEGAPSLRQQRSRPPRPHQSGPAFELLPPFGKIGISVHVQQEHVNAAVDSLLKYMSTNPEEAVSSVLSAAYRLPRIAPFLARVVSTVAAADEDFHAAIVTRLVRYGCSPFTHIR